MIYRVELTDQAKRDLFDIYEYVAFTFSVSLLGSLYSNQAFETYAASHSVVPEL